MVLRGYLFMANPARREWIHRLLLASGKVTIHHGGDTYPDNLELRNLGRQVEPEVVFLDLEYAEVAAAVRNAMQDVWRNTAWVHIPKAMPEDAATLESWVFAAMQSRPDAGRGARVMTLVPAKAGCGASTIAWNLAHAAAANGARVLLIEADLRSGALSFIVNQQQPGSLQAALRMAEQRDHTGVRQSLIPHAGIDLLLSSRRAMDPPPEWASYLLLLDQLRPQYDLIFVDLPELINPATIHLAAIAERVLVVTTPELIPLKLAEHRCREIEEWGIPADRVRLILNRAQRNELTARDIEANLHRPVAAAFPNDYAALRKSVLEGQPVSERSALGEAVRGFALTLAPGGAARHDSGLLGYLRRFAGAGTPAAVTSAR
jgi:Flp pilus assembly CpaE family ATPase